jgi:hypothetical protein
MKTLAPLALTITLTIPALSQTPATSTPAPSPSDVQSIPSILTALYAVISGPAGDRDWPRFRSLFAKDARLTSVAKEASDHPARLMSADDYSTLASGYFKTHAFYENAIVNRSKNSATSPRSSPATNPATPPPKNPSHAASTPSNSSTTKTAGGS